MLADVNVKVSGSSYRVRK